MEAVLGVSANFKELIVNHPTCLAALAARSHQEYLSRLKWLALDCRDLLSAATKFIASVERKSDPTSVDGSSVSMGSTSDVRIPPRMGSARDSDDGDLRAVNIRWAFCHRRSRRRDTYSRLENRAGWKSSRFRRSSSFGMKPTSITPELHRSTRRKALKWR